jgi:hypothetical protein
MNIVVFQLYVVEYNSSWIIKLIRVIVMLQSHKNLFTSHQFKSLQRACQQFRLHMRQVAYLAQSLMLLFVLAVNHEAYAHETHAHTSQLAQHLAFDAAGTLWRAQIENGFVIVDSSQDLAKTFVNPIKINSLSQVIKANSEERPQIAIGPDATIYVLWTQALNQRASSYIWFSRSVNHGKSFEKPMIVHQDRAEITHAYASLNVSPQGLLTVAWIDTRDLIAAREAGKSYIGAALYYAQSRDSGATFSGERKLTDAGCECCRLASTHKPDGTLTLLWRAIFDGNERDHMVAEIPKNGETTELHRASFGHWKVDGCPHHGAALASGGDGEQWWGYHMAYYDGQDKKPGLYYARMDGEAWASSVPKRIGNPQHQAGHPALLSVAGKVWLVWREMHGSQQQLFGMFSDDDGKNWTDAKLLFNTENKLDYPQLLNHHGTAYLTVNSAKRGFKLIPLNALF